MGKHHIRTNAVCPFYKHEHPQVIYCDGIVPDSVIHLAFANKTDAKEYKLGYCLDNYEDCLIAQMLEEVCEDE